MRPGAHVQVISPATSLSFIRQEQRALATQRLQDMGLRVSFSDHAEETGLLNTGSIASRVKDLHRAFSDDSVDTILTTIGGYNSNQLLRYLDYDLIRKNPKIFCGFSDITALSLAIFAKTGLISYSGPHFSTFGMLKGIDYTIEYFKKCLFHDAPYDVPQSDTWSDDRWYANQEERLLVPSEGYTVINEGEAEGILLGGNLSTIVLLHGTEYLSDLSDSILLIEDDSEASAPVFDRYLQSLIHQETFKAVKGIIIGRFQRDSQLSDTTLRHIIKTKQELAHLPVIANASFGHTTPQFTFPIGGKARLIAHDNRVSFQIIQH